MNTLPGNLFAFELIAEQTVADRVRDAQRRAQARAARAHHRKAGPVRR